VDRQEIVATEEEEQRLFRQRRTDGLLKLRQAQRKWRQCQRQSQRRRRQQAQDKAASEVEVSPTRGRNSRGKFSSRLESSTQVFLAPLEEEEDQSQGRPSTSESLVTTSSEGIDEPPRLPAMVLQKALLRRNSLQRAELMTADNTSAKDVISSDVNLAELFDAGEEETEEGKKNKWGSQCC